MGSTRDNSATTESRNQPAPVATPISGFAVDGFNTAAVIRKIGDKCAAGEWETVCVVKTDDWKELAALYAAAPAMLEALREISRGAGPFSRDPLTHADNCIDAMKALAIEAIFKATGAQS